MLDLRARLLASESRAGSASGFLGFENSTRSLAPALRPPGAQAIREVALPVLLACLREDRATDLTTAALIALARIGDDLEEETAALVEDELRERLGHAEQEVSESAALALGILGRAGSAPALAELVLAAAEAPALLRRSSVPERTRVFAAYGLGLLAHGTQDEDVRAFSADSLARAFDGAREAARPDLPVACLLAYARSALPPRAAAWSDGADPRRAPRSREEQALLILAAFEQRALDRVVRAHAAVALGWIAGGAAFDAALRLTMADALCKGLSASKSEGAVRRGALLALGELVGGGPSRSEARARELLAEAASSEADGASRLLACLSLARVAARSEASAPEVARALRAELLGGLAERGSTRRWSALALGLGERLRSRQGREPDASVARALASAARAAGAPEDVAALAAACALAEAAGAAEPLLAALERVAQDGPRAGLLLALGVLGAEEARDPLAAELARSTYRPELLRDAAVALGLLGDAGVVERLTALLGQATSGTAQASLSQALGMVGDGQALAPLARLAGDRGRPAATRAFAAAALGRVADRDPVPWSLPLSAGVLFTDAPATLFAPEGNGVLNIL